MILTGLLNILKNFILYIIDVLPDLSYSMPDFTPVLDFIKWSQVFVSPVVIIGFFTSIIVWSVVHPLWGVIEWLYKKIPGIS